MNQFCILKTISYYCILLLTVFVLHVQYFIDTCMPVLAQLSLWPTSSHLVLVSNVGNIFWVLASMFLICGPGCIIRFIQPARGPPFVIQYCITNGDHNLMCSKKVRYDFKVAQIGPIWATVDHIASLCQHLVSIQDFLLTVWLSNNFAQICLYGILQSKSLSLPLSSFDRRHLVWTGSSSQINCKGIGCQSKLSLSRFIALHSLL